MNANVETMPQRERNWELPTRGHVAMFALIVGSFHVVTRQTWRIGWVARPTDADRRDNVACHKAISAAIGDHDVRLAEAKMSEHFDNTVKVLLAAGIN